MAIESNPGRSCRMRKFSSAAAATAAARARQGDRCEAARKQRSRMSGSDTAGGTEKGRVRTREGRPVDGAAGGAVAFDDVSALDQELGA